MNANAGPVGANGALFGAGFSRETAAAAQAMEAHRRRRDGSMDQSEEDYFNTDDDDEEEEAVGPAPAVDDEPLVGPSPPSLSAQFIPMAAEYEAGLVGSKRPLVDEEYAGDDDTGKRIKQNDGVEEEGLTAAQRNALTGLNAEPNVEVATDPNSEGGEVEHKPTSKPTSNWVSVGQEEQNQ